MSKSFFKMQNNNVSPLEVTFKWQKPAIFDQKTIYRSSVQFTLPIIILILDFTRCWSKPLWVGLWVRHFWSFIFITINNRWDLNVDISGALSAKDVNNIWVLKIIRWTMAKCFTFTRGEILKFHFWSRLISFGFVH